MEVKGNVFNIQKFSINDGPGIRTTVFLKGCPLNCIWCHNPESKNVKNELFFASDKCTLCRKCEYVCKNGCHTFNESEHIYNRQNCIVCGDCANNCLMGALEVVSKQMAVSEVIESVLRDKAFYDNSGGGITVSGGEPMLQFEFTYELLKLAKQNGLHTCIETCGYAGADNFKKIAPYVDIFLYDYKETDDKKHMEYTGVSNKVILENLRMLDDIGSKIILRCPIIPTLNDRQEHFEGIAKTADSLKNIIEINIEPYHPLGMGKAQRLDKEYKLDELTFPSEETVKEWIDKISAKTDIPVKKA